jgi:hypothetical protein
MHQAKKAKNDEFYTQISDIEKELLYYKQQFDNKIVFCNCDDPEASHFWKYFDLNFDHLNLKKLISTHYDKEKPTYKLEIARDKNNKKLKPIKTNLIQNGDFRSQECIDLLKESDIICTNPPFSLFREYVDLLIKYDKKFLIIGNYNAVTYKEIFKLIKDNKLWLGYQFIKEFLQEDGTIKKFGNIHWFTNLDVKKRNEFLDLRFKSYEQNPELYPKYDNYNAININKVKDIPGDYNGAIGVPITFLEYYNPKQFEIIKFRKGDDNKDLMINKKCPYFRIIIQKINK